MPFQSEAQRRYMHMRHPEIAHRWEHEYPSKKRKKKLPYHVNKRYPGETSRDSWQRHQRQVQAGIMLGAAVPAVMALRSGKLASTAGFAGHVGEQATHASRQLRHAATATALGGLGGAVGVLPVPKSVSGQVGNAKRRYKSGGGLAPFSVNAKPKLPRSPRQKRPSSMLPQRRKKDIYTKAETAMTVDKAWVAPKLVRTLRNPVSGGYQMGRKISQAQHASRRSIRAGNQVNAEFQAGRAANLRASAKGVANPVGLHVGRHRRAYQAAGAATAVGGGYGAASEGLHRKIKLGPTSKALPLEGLNEVAHGLGHGAHTTFHVKEMKQHTTHALSAGKPHVPSVATPTAPKISKPKQPGVIKRDEEGTAMHDAFGVARPDLYGDEVAKAFTLKPVTSFARGAQRGLGGAVNRAKKGTPLRTGHTFGANVRQTGMQAGSAIRAHPVASTAIGGGTLASGGALAASRNKKPRYF